MNRLSVDAEVFFQLFLSTTSFIHKILDDVSLLKERNTCGNLYGVLQVVA